MSFDPQIPSWGKSFLAKNLDNLECERFALVRSDVVLIPS